MNSISRPDNVRIEQIAARNPKLLNPLFAYFVMGWLSVTIGTNLLPHTGMDPEGKRRKVPDYVESLGVDSVVWALIYSPETRGPADEAGIDLLLRQLP